MQIVYGEYPPNYKAIAEAFNLKGNDGVVFTYGNKLYVPSGNTIDKHLLKHEEMHARNQLKMGIHEWWERYLVDSGFRFMQELEAYRVQYKSMAVLPLDQRLAYLDHIATDLSGSMYGNLLSKDEAKAEITKDIILKRPSNRADKNIRKSKKRERQNRKKGRR